MHKSNRDTFETLKSSLLICVVIGWKVEKQDKKWIAARMGRELAIGFTSWGFPLVRSCNTDSASTHWTHESRKLKLQVILGKASICPGLAFSFGGVCQVLTSTYSTLQTSFSHTWVWLFIDLEKHPHPPFFVACEPSNIQGLVIFFHPFTVSCAQVEALIFQMIQSLPIVGGEKIFLKN